MVNHRKALDMLLVSRVRVKLLKYFFTHPDVPVHLRGAARELKEEINAVRRELLRMEEIKLVKADLRGNRKYYILEKQGPFVDELRGIIFKSFGLGGLLLRNLGKIGDPNFIILTGNYLTGVEGGQAVDLVLIGDLELSELEKLIAEYELKENRQINYTVFKLADFDVRKKRKDAFVLELLLNSKLMLLGSYEDLIA